MSTLSVLPHLAAGTMLRYLTQLHYPGAEQSSHWPIQFVIAQVITLAFLVFGMGRELGWLKHEIGEPGDSGMNPGHCYSI